MKHLLDFTWAGYPKKYIHVISTEIAEYFKKIKPHASFIFILLLSQFVNFKFNSSPTSQNLD